MPSISLAGILEKWSIGVMKKQFFSTHYSNIPTLHHSPVAGSKMARILYFKSHEYFSLQTHGYEHKLNKKIN